MKSIYHDGNRDWQDRFDSRPLADRLAEVTIHDELEERDREFIESRDMFFISTVDAAGCPTVSYKGGNSGFIRALDRKTIAFPGYDGNGMFLTAGNIETRPEVGLLFVDFENPIRLRLHGTASIHVDDPLLGDYPEAQYMVRVNVANLFVNCPRYIHRYKRVASSEFVPRDGCTTPAPEWKESDDFKDVVPELKSR